MPTAFERQLERDRKIDEMHFLLKEIYEHLGLGEKNESEDSEGS